MEIIVEKVNYIYINKTIIYDGKWLNGKKNGFGKEYNGNEIIIYEGCFKEDKRNGIGKENHDNGTIK